MSGLPGGVAFVCPRCRGPLESTVLRHRCPACARDYPVIGGIPDFRLEPDPYIGLDDDRKKGEALAREGRTVGFEALLRHYYAITPEDPPDLAVRWTARALAEVEIARALLDDARLLTPDPGTLLDIGCATGALLIAARERAASLVGVDVAFRWLAVGQVRLREAGVPALLVCANAEHLPFADASFRIITASDAIEYVRDAGAMLREAARVARPDARLLAASNNRYAPLPEPSVHLWGVGYFPRRWQARYVAWRRRDLHPYRMRLRSATELNTLVRGAGWSDVRVEPARLVAPHVRSAAFQRALMVYNALIGRPLIATLLKQFGPRLRIAATASSRALPPPSP